MAHSSCDLDHLLKLSVRHGKLLGVLQISPIDRADLIDAITLVAYLEGADIVPKAINHEAIAQLVQAVHDNPALPHEGEVANGTEPASGRDAEITLDPTIRARIVEIQSRQSAYDTAAANGTLKTHHQTVSKDPIDFYTMSPFLIVQRGDRVCSITPSEKGQDGQDIFGEPIACKNGKDRSPIVDGSLTASGEIVTASTAGILLIEDTKIRVSPTLEIDGTVDFATANIDFPGDVTISDGVLDNFVVQCSGSATIGGLVQASIVRAEQNIHLTQGMAGKDTGVMIARGDLHAGYLEAVHAVVGGNCTIGHEITNSVLTIAGELQAPNAPIRGGELTVGNHCELGAIGSIGGVKTSIIIGHLPEIALLTERSVQFMLDAEQDLVLKRAQLEVFRHSMGKPSIEQAQEIADMETVIDELETKSRDLNNAIQQLMGIQQTKTKPSLRIHRAIYAKSTIFMPGYKAVFKQDLLGECTIELPEKGGPIIDHAGARQLLKEIAKVYPDKRIPRIEQHEGVRRIAA